MIEGEKKHYDNSLKNMLSSLHKTYEENQQIIKLKIDDLDSRLDRIDAHIKGIKTMLNNETEYLRGTINDAIATRYSLKEVIEDLDPDVIDKIKKITEIIIYGGD